jgi:hypothetical protein
MSTQCPAGHASTEPDFCSECGLAIAAPSAPADAQSATPPSQPSAGSGRERCPKCNEERDDPRAQFCGVCSYDFVNKVGGDVVEPPPVAPPIGQPATGSTPATPPVTASGARLDIEVSVAGAAPLKFSLFDEESLVGRKSASTPQTVGVAGDDAISRRQFMITRQKDGSYSVRDLGSSNGTKLNGTTLVSGQESPIKEGDVIEIGEHTRITVSAVRR